MRLLLFASILAAILIPENPIHAASGPPSDVRVVAPSRFDVSPPLRMIGEGSASTHGTQVIESDWSRPEDKIEPAPPKPHGAHAKSTTVDARGLANTAVNFDGMRVTDNSVGLAPASPYIGVSDEYIVQTVNLLMAVYDRTGNLLFGPVANDLIFAGFGNGDCDTYNTGYPLVLYDEDADRWLVSHVSWSSSFSGDHCIAISRTNDPRGSWYRYRFEISNTGINDWPMMGVGKNAYYSAYNMFGTNYLGAIAAAFERDAMIAGDPGAQLILFGPDPNRHSLLPFDIEGGFPASGVPGYFAEINPFSSLSHIHVYEMNVDWSVPSNSTFSEIVTLSPSPFDPDLCIAVREECIPQPNGQALTAISDRIMPRLQFREFTNHYSMVFNHTVDADGAGRAGVRWYELRDEDKNGTWSIYQQGTHAPADGLYRWMGSIAMDASGNIALGYTASSATQPPSIRYTARTFISPLGQMTFPEEVIASGVSQGGTARWGDYSTMVTDVDSFWFSHQYGANTGSSFNWATRIARIVFDPDDITPPDAIADLSASASFSSPPLGATVQLSWTAPADDAGDTGSGPVIGYDIRLSTVGPIANNTDFDAASPVGLFTANAPGTLETFRVPGLDFDTQFWFAVRAGDDNGNASISNSANFTTGPAPNVALNPTFLSGTLDPNQTGTVTLNIANTGPAGSRLEFSLPEFDQGSDGARSFGGPDTFGYSWIDSNQTGGPTFEWIDISVSGTPLGLVDDDGIFVSLPFDFPFYGQTKNQIGISSNGYLTFDNSDATPSDLSNTGIPDADSPDDLIAVYWDDLDPGNSDGGGGEIYYRDTGDGRFIVQYEAVPHFPDGDGEVSSFQAILYDSGAIKLQYLSMTDDVSAPNSYTVGIEDSDALDGLEVAFDTAYLEDDLAVAFALEPKFIVDADPASGVIESGDDLNVTITLDSQNLEIGPYLSELLLETNVPGSTQSSIAIPTSLMVGLFADGFED